MPAVSAMPTVSVIIPAYNAERYLAETLESVLAQTLADLEVIVVDDGSTDTTCAIVEELAARDARISLLRQENSYAGVARNNGMARARGTYLYFLDADDTVEPEALETMVAAAESCAADVVICRSRKFDTATGETEEIYYALRDWPLETPLSQEDVAKTLFRSVVGWPWDKLFRRSFIEATGLEYQPLRSTNDAYFVFCALALAHTTYCVPRVLVNHRVNNAASTSNTRKRSWNNAVIAMGAIGSKLRQEGIYELFERTYVNWLVNFTKWNVNTLDDESAAGLVGAARELMAGVTVPLEREFYFLGEDLEFAEVLAMGEDELVVRVQRQRAEVQRAKLIYGSKAYQLAQRFIKPAKWFKYRVLKRS